MKGGVKQGKMKKGKGASAKVEKHALSLHEELDADLASERASSVKRKQGLSKKRKFQEAEDVLEAGLTSKILQQARKQQQEIAREMEKETGQEATRQAFDMAAAVVASVRGRGALKEKAGGATQAAVDSEEEDDEADVDDVPPGSEEDHDADKGGVAGRSQENVEGRGEDQGGARSAKKGTKAPGHARGADEDGDDADSAYGDETASQYHDDGHDVTEEDERAIAVFLDTNAEAHRQRTLADVIREKLTSAQAEASRGEASGGAPPLSPEMQTKVEAVYRGVGEILSRYSAGKVPKAFKLIPALSNWEEVLHLTAPEKWTAPAMYAATRLFASNLNSRMAQRFFRLVLLPRVRQDIRENKRLHFSLYQALKKALYKPSAFFKGVLLPICQSRTCSLREAVVLGSVIQKVSIPVLHSSVALMRIAEMPYAGTNSYFMKLFFDKKYALPYRVLDAVVNHYMRFLEDPRDLPVIWHQSLLSFVQRYKNELTSQQKKDLRALFLSQNHYLMTPEVTRELNSSVKNRGEQPMDVDPLKMGFATLRVMSKKPKIEEDFRNLPKVDLAMEED